MRNTVWEPNSVDDNFIREKILATDQVLLKRAVFLRTALKKDLAFRVRSGQLEKFSVAWYNQYYAIIRVSNTIIYLFNRNGLDGKVWLKHAEYMFRGPNANTKAAPNGTIVRNRK